MDKFESKLTLSGFLKRNPLIYVEHENKDGFSYGRYYTFNKDIDLYDITFEIACALDMYNDFYIASVFNRKTNRSFKCIKVRHPQTLVRDLSQELFLKWNAIEFYSLRGERIF